MSKQCKCGKGHVSQWDGKCGHCRTKKEQEDHEHALDMLSEMWSTSREQSRDMYKEIRSYLR